MFANYRAAFRAPGSVAFSAASFVMRMPIAIYGLALILLISTRTHHYGFAGLLGGAYIIGGAAGNPFGARLVDRHGQGRVLLPLTAVHVAAVIVLVVLTRVHVPDWTYLLPTFVIGFCYLPVGSLVRARWSYALAGRPELATAYSFESIADEVIFVVGPLIATVIATQIDPVLGVILAGTLVAVGSLLLARLTATEPPRHPAGSPARRSVLHQRGMVMVTLASVAMGAIFASAEVTMIAFCGQHGDQALSGAVIACFAFGSGISGLWYGGRTWARPLLARFRLQALIMAVLPWLLFASTRVGVLAACAFVVGFGIAPTLITTFALISRIVDDSALTEGLSWLSTGINVGYGIAAAAVGRIADTEGARAGFGVTVGAATALGLIAVRLHALLRHTVTEPEPVAAASP
jgi:predicted MFS family arabinose efflux permease